METLGAFVFSVITLVSTLVMSPNSYTQSNVLGDETTKSGNLLKDRNVEIQDTFETNKQKFSNRKQDVRSNLEASKSSAREKFKLMTDERKKQIAERICNNLTSVNEKYADHLSNFGEHLSQLLDKVAARLTQDSQNGGNSSCQVALGTARTSLNTALAAVQTQESKSYACPPVNDTTAKSTLTSLHQTFKNDVAAVRTPIRQAHPDLKTLTSCISTARSSPSL